MKKLICLLICFYSCGCVPVLIGAVAYSEVHKQQRRQQFLADFNKTNTEREANHLKPLDYCTELHRFDKSIKDKECKELSMK